MKTNNRHRGEILQQVVKNNGIKINTLMTRMGYNRTSFYNHIKDDNLDIEILKKYGKVISHDFSQDFPEMIQYFIQEPEPDHYETMSTKDLIKLTKSWKEKFIVVLEENRNLRKEIEILVGNKR